MDVLSSIWTLSTGNELIAGSVGERFSLIAIHSSLIDYDFAFTLLVGGAAQVLVGQPLDTVKTRAQIAPSKQRQISTMNDRFITLTRSAL